MLQFLTGDILFLYKIQLQCQSSQKRPLFLPLGLLYYFVLWHSAVQFLLLLLVHILRTVLITQDSLFRFLEPSSGPGMWPVLSREQLAWCIAVSLCTLFLSECVDLDTCRKLPWRDPVSLAVTKYFCFFGNVCFLPFHSGQWKSQGPLPQWLKGPI